MALKKFTVGKFEIEAVVLGELVDMTLTVNIAFGDVTKIGTTWEAIIELGRSWEVAVSCNYNPADTAQAALITAYTSGDVAFSSITVFEDASGQHLGSALLTSAVITKAVGSVDKFNATFKGDGALSHTT
ncbi:hypothetical protein LCGC14_1796520 [marine sediment metagenome]|uniref:Uncharacterized protein n=1 Tax=marine sediment metagenome TaxID=412755 RepID=A0A0F9J5Q1_9ZZZZ